MITVSRSQTVIRATMDASPKGAGYTVRGLTRSTSTEPKEGLMPNSTVGKNDPLIHASLSYGDWLQTKILGRLNGYPNPAVCWTWTGSTAARGYGYAYIPAAVSGRFGLSVPVHRVVWIATRGPIPPGLVLDHDAANGCHNKACANPAHLTVVTQRTNIAINSDSVSAQNVRKTHCPNGHALSEGNLVAAVVRRGGRNCRECQLDGARKQYALMIAAARVLGLTKRAYIAAYGQSRSAASSVLAEHGIEVA